MRSVFRPHDGDGTTGSMEGVWMGSWVVVKRSWAAKREGFRATRLIIGASNDLQMERNLTAVYRCYTKATRQTSVHSENVFNPLMKIRSERGDGLA